MCGKLCTECCPRIYKFEFAQPIWNILKHEMTDMPEVTTKSLIEQRLDSNHHAYKDREDKHWPAIFGLQPTSV